MYWLCFNESSCGVLQVARTDVDQAPPRGQICMCAEDLSLGDLAALPALDVPDGIDEAVLWYGDNAQETCSMLRAVHDLHRRGVPLSLVHVGAVRADELPPLRRLHSAVSVVTDAKWKNALLRIMPQFVLHRLVDRQRKQERAKQPPNAVIFFRGAGEIDLEYVPFFYAKRRALPACEADRLAQQWERLVAENAPLRVLENGKIVSADLSYYDAAILSNVPAEETIAARVIGRTLADCRVSDEFVFARLRALAAAGELTILQNGPTYRETTVCRP